MAGRDTRRLSGPASCLAHDKSIKGLVFLHERCVLVKMLFDIEKTKQNKKKGPGGSSDGGRLTESLEPTFDKIIALPLIGIK